MAKVGYILHTAQNGSYEADIEWMNRYGCCTIVEEIEEHEKLRPQWKQLLSELRRGDEIIVTQFSNAVRGVRELSFFLEYCRKEMLRVISIHDGIDSGDILFPESNISTFLNVIATLPADIVTMRIASTHEKRLLKPRKPNTPSGRSKLERDKTIVNLYRSGHPIDEIWRISGFRSRSSVFRILLKYGVSFNRGHSQEEIQRKINKNKNLSV